MVMPANNTSALVKQLGRFFPGRLGLLIGPGGWREPCPYLPYALDNGAFGAWRAGSEWDAAAFVALLEKAKAADEAGRGAPIWVAVPDVVADAPGTRAKWTEWEPVVRAYGFRCAFVVQDGMERQDVPASADLVFVGGSTAWKWSTLPAWTSWFRRVHVGRVNTLKRLVDCHELGVESVDGTGWFRGDITQGRELVQYVSRTHARQVTIFEPFPEREEETEPPAVVCSACNAALRGVQKGEVG